MKYILKLPERSYTNKTGLHFNLQNLWLMQNKFFEGTEFCKSD